MFVVIEMVKSRKRFFLPLLFKRFKSFRRRRLFHRQWDASGVIGSVVDVRFFLVGLLSFFFFLLLAAAFLHLIFLCSCCVFMTCPALLTAIQRLCWISRLTGDLFLVRHLLLR